MFFTLGQFWPSGIVIACVCGSVCLCVCVCVCQSRACLHDNSSLIQARITKFRPDIQNTLVQVPFVLGDDRLWTSMSNLTWKLNFTPFWACSHHNSSAIQARITKFGPVLHSRWASHPICDPSRIIATWCSYCSVNSLHPQNCIYLQSDLSCFYKLNCNLFNHHERLDLMLTNRPLHEPWTGLGDSGTV